jgi:hypothetical protein
MGKPRKTGNPLFDIVWAEWPPRITGAGVWEKRKKGPARKKFEQINPTEEEAYDMVAWIRKDKECREKAKASNSFFTPPADLIVFLNNGSWEDEIGVEITDSQRYEKKRSQTIHSKTVTGHIETWSKLIHEWSIEKLRASTSFMSAYDTYAEFRAWVQKELPNRPKADPVKLDPPKPVIVAKPVPVAIPPPEPTRVDRFKSVYRDRVAFKKEKFPLL